MSSRLAEALNSTTFYVVSAAGIALALVLTVVEIQAEPAVEVEVASSERTGSVSVVDARATNTTDEPQCPEIRIAARDGDGVDLDEVVATPVEGSERIQPGQSLRYRGELTDVTEQEINEELDEYAAYVWELGSCE